MTTLFMRWVLERRLWFHRSVSPRSFTKKYRVDRLVYYETFRNPRDAISREKEIKGWRREKKNDLVRRLNPKWEDLGEKLFRDGRRGPSLRSGRHSLILQGRLQAQHRG